jgi:hypothetical protein
MQNAFSVNINCLLFSLLYRQKKALNYIYSIITD